MSELVIFLESGNYFKDFQVIDLNTVKFEYYDRRRNQIARHYTVRFEENTLGVKSIIAVSAAGGRVEQFSTCKVLTEAKNIILAARHEAWEREYAEEVEDIKDRLEAEEAAKAALDAYYAEDIEEFRKEEEADKVSPVDTVNLVGLSIMLAVIVTTTLLLVGKHLF